jgi:hypothetical protein
MGKKQPKYATETIRKTKNLILESIDDLDNILELVKEIVLKVFHHRDAKNLCLTIRYEVKSLKEILESKAKDGNSKFYNERLELETVGEFYGVKNIYGIEIADFSKLVESFCEDIDPLINHLEEARHEVIFHHLNRLDEEAIKLRKAISKLHFWKYHLEIILNFFQHDEYSDYFDREVSLYGETITTEIEKLEKLYVPLDNFETVTDEESPGSIKAGIQSSVSYPVLKKGEKLRWKGNNDELLFLFKVLEENSFLPKEHLTKAVDYVMQHFLDKNGNEFNRKSLQTEFKKVYNPKEPHLEEEPKRSELLKSIPEKIKEKK